MRPEPWESEADRDAHICSLIEAETLLRLGDWDTRW